MKYHLWEAQQSRGHKGWEYFGPFTVTREDIAGEFGVDPDKRRHVVQVLPFGMGSRWVRWMPA
jgi:hypothetical protein